MQGVDSASFKQAEALARKAIKLDDADALAHHILGVTASHKGDHAAGASLQRRALNLNPSLVYAYHGLGVCLIYSGQPDEGLRSVETAIRLSPRDFMLPMWKMDIAAGQWVLGQHQESLATLSEVLTERPRWTAALALKSCNLAALGEDAAAKSVYEEVKRIKPNFQVARLEGIFQFDQTQFRRLTDGLRRVGWE